MYDTIIVGAGSAGCVLANRLSADPHRKVLVLEAGRAAPVASDIPSDWPTMFNTAVDWSYYTEPQAGCRGRRIFWPRGKMIGGSGAMNAMIYIRGLPSDYDGWAQAGCEGWAWRDVLPKLIAFENNARFTDDPFHGTSGPLHVADVPHVDPNELKWLEAAQAAGLPHNPNFSDIATMIEGVRINRRIAAQFPLKEMIEGEITPSAEAVSDAEIAEYIRGHCTTLYHAASTCRMGTDDLAVVDPKRLQVRGIDGLHVADASVIPIMISGNIQTPTILIAECAATAILG